MQQLELPSTQYTKLIRYKSTLGCSSDAELIGLLTQTFLCTLAQPLSISSKEVDILLTQGQQEPKIRNIVMSLLVQFLSTHSPSQQDQPNNLSTNNNFNNLFPTPPSSQQEPVTSHNIVFLPPPQEEHVSPQNISPVKIEQLQSPHQSLLIPSDNTNSPNNQYDVQGSNQSSEELPSVSLAELNTLSSNDNNLSFNNNNNNIFNNDLPTNNNNNNNNNNIFNNNNLTDNLTNNIHNNNNNVVDLCDDKMEIQGPSIDHTPDHSMSPPCTNGGTPCGTQYGGTPCGTNSGTPCSNSGGTHCSGSNSPSKENDWLDNLTAEQLLELTKQLKTDDSSSTDEILVNKLLTVINDLVDNTEFSLTDVVDLMKGSLSTPSDDTTMETNDVTKPLSKDDVIANINNVISFNNDNNLMNNQDVKQGFSPGGFNAMNNVNGYLVPTTWVPIKLSPLPQQMNSNKVSHNSQPQLLPSKHEKKENVCNTCNTRFSQFSSLLRHIRQVHQKIKDKPCPVCGERFARSQYLPNHIWRTHYNRATLHVKCLFCEAVLDTKEGIQSHLWFNHVKARR